MITINSAATPLRTNHYCHHKSTVLATKSLATEAFDCCWCSCDTIIPALADLDFPNDRKRNDIYSYLFLFPSNCTAVAKLTNLDTGTEYTITDNSLGIFYDTGDLKLNVWGFIVQWQKVATAHGFGNYQFSIVVENSSTVEILNKAYPAFRLMPYSCETAHETVRIESVNSGYIEGGFDYRGLTYIDPYGTGQFVTNKSGWTQQIRWYGRFELRQRPTQTDNIHNTQRELLQVQTQIERGYNLRLDFIKEDISNHIIEDNLLADYLTISDYNANNPHDLKNIKVSLASIDDPEPFFNKTELHNIKFVPYKQNNLKRKY